MGGVDWTQSTSQWAVNDTKVSINETKREGNFSDKVWGPDGQGQVPLTLKTS